MQSKIGSTLNNIPIKLIIIAVFQLFTIHVFGQADTCWTVLLVEKGNELEVKQDMESFSKTGFYMYRNCIYSFKTKKEEYYTGRLVDIKPDTLFFTNFFNENVAASYGEQLDTFRLHYTQLSKLRLIADRTMGLYKSHSFDNFNFIFKKEKTTRCSLESEWAQIFTNDTSKYEIVTYLTAQGINLLHEEDGRTYYFSGYGLYKPDRSKMDTTYSVKNGLWFTPCKVEQINGLAIGFIPENLKNAAYNEKDSLEINGLNLDVNIFQVFMTLLNPYVVGPYADSVAFYHESLKNTAETTINGLNVSVVNTIHNTALNGVNVTPLITLVNEVDGLSISGLSNFAYKLNGVSIAGIYNRATVAKGLQVGLINKSADMRGIQIGLWSTNGKRSLPFINWQFKAKKK